MRLQSEVLDVITLQPPTVPLILCVVPGVPVLILHRRLAGHHRIRLVQLLVAASGTTSKIEIREQSMGRWRSRLRRTQVSRLEHAAERGDDVVAGPFVLLSVQNESNKYERERDAYLQPPAYIPHAIVRLLLLVQRLEEVWLEHLVTLPRDRTW